MKLKLENLYQDYVPLFVSIVYQFPDIDIAGPLLISPNGNYENQKVKLLVIGQETNGWGYHSEDIKIGMRHYEEFNLGEKYYSSPFWNVTRKVERLLGNNDFSCAWTNISKYDVEAGRPFGNYLIEISKIDDLLIKEIEILRPDLSTGQKSNKRFKFKVVDHMDFEFIQSNTKQAVEFCLSFFQILNGYAVALLQQPFAGFHRPTES